MAAINGTLYVPYSGAASLAATDKIFSTKSATLKIDVDLPDVTTKDSGGWAQHITGAKNWSIDFDGVYDEADATNLNIEEIMVIMVAALAPRYVAFAPADFGTTTAGWEGLGTFKGVTITGDKETGITFSGSIVGTGALAVFTP